MRVRALSTLAATAMALAIAGSPAAGQTMGATRGTEASAPAEQAAAASQYQNEFVCIPGSCQPVPGEAAADQPGQKRAPESVKATPGGEAIWKQPDVVISSFQTGGSTAGEKPATPPPDTSNDDCMSCAD